jgi:hypothetical protein
MKTKKKKTPPAKPPHEDLGHHNMVLIESLNAAAYNPRDISPEAFEALKASIQKFGMPQPVVVNQRNKVIVGGHMRLRAAAALGWDSVPVHWVDLPEIEEKALNVALNSPKLQGYFTEGLQDILSEIQNQAPMDFQALKLDELVMPDLWATSGSVVDSVESNLEGIVSTIKVKCPQDVKDQVLSIITRALSRNQIPGVEIV